MSDAPPTRLQAARDAVVMAARRLSHGMRRDGLPQRTARELREALDRAVDDLETIV